MSVFGRERKTRGGLYPTHTCSYCRSSHSKVKVGNEVSVDLHSGVRGVILGRVSITRMQSYVI